MTPSKFSDRNLEKNFGEKIFPQWGLIPKNFDKRIDSSTRAMCLQNFIAISQKLWPAGRDKVRADKMKKKKKRQTRRCPAKTGSPIALIHIPLDSAERT